MCLAMDANHVCLLAWGTSFNVERRHVQYSPLFLLCTLAVMYSCSWFLGCCQYNIFSYVVGG